MKLTTDKHEASRGLTVTAELLVFETGELSTCSLWHRWQTVYVGCCCAGYDGDADDAGDDDDDDDDDDGDDVAPITSTWPHLRCDVGLEEGEY